MAQRVNTPQTHRQIHKAARKFQQKTIRYCCHLQYHLSLSDIRDEVINRLGGSTSPWWQGFSLFALTAAVGFGIFAAYTYSTTLADLLDPGNNGSSIYTIIGVSFSIVNIVCGHLIKEGFETNSITGKASGYIWKTVVGMAGIIMMGTFFYLLTSTLVQFTGGSHLPFVVICTILLEASFGAILITPYRYVKLLLVQISLWLNSKLLSYYSRKCDQYYLEFQRCAETYNNKTSDNES